MTVYVRNSVSVDGRTVIILYLGGGTHSDEMSNMRSGINAGEKGSKFSLML